MNILIKLRNGNRTLEHKVINDDVSEITRTTYISIDCSYERNGRCYTSFRFSHGLIGESPVIARTFTEFLLNILNYKGDYFFWEEDDLKSYGDAYDNINDL